MTANLDRLLSTYENGHLSRRELLMTIAALVAAAPPAHAADAAVGPVKQLNHVSMCLGVENFDADKALKALTDRGVTARLRQRGDTKELYLTDPDGVSVQLQDTKYIGGLGPLGDRKP